MHRPLVQGLMAGRLEWLPTVLMEAEDAGLETVFFSIEGLSWHFMDFSPEALEQFRAMTAGCTVELVLSWRDPDAWSQSMYRQCLVNPVNPRFSYGAAMTLDAFRGLQRVAALMDHDSLVQSMSAGFGAGSYHIAQYSGPWPETFCNILKVPDLLETLRTLPPQNHGFDDIQCEIVRQINGFDLPKHQRSLMLWMLQKHFGSDMVIAKSIAPSDITRNTMHVLAPVLDRVVPSAPGVAGRVAAVKQTLEAYMNQSGPSLSVPQAPPCH